MKKFFLEFVKVVGVRMIKTMAETAISLIGANTIGVTDVDWLGVLSACALSGIVTILFNIKSLPDLKQDNDTDIVVW